MRGGTDQELMLEKTGDKLRIGPGVGTEMRGGSGQDSERGKRGGRGERCEADRVRNRNEKWRGREDAQRIGSGVGGEKRGRATRGGSGQGSG